MQQETQDRRRVIGRRVLALIAALVALSWVPKGVHVIVRSWSASSEVLAREQAIDETRRRLSAIESQVDFAATEEGCDVEAKRQFGVGSPDEIWVTVDAQPTRPSPGTPLGIGDRVQGWLTSAGDRCIERVRHAIRVARYAVGLDDVDDCLPAVVEVRDEPVEAEPAPEDDTGASE